MSDPFEYEQLRLAAVSRFGAIDIQSDAAYHRLTRLASQTCRVPLAAMAFVDANRVCIKSSFGSAIPDSVRDGSFSDLVISSPTVTVIPDALKDSRLVPSPLPNGEKMRFCAGVPLTTSDGYRIGTIVVLDTRARRRGLTRKEAEMLQELAALAIDRLELRLERMTPTKSSKRLPQIDARFREFIESSPQGIIGVAKDGSIALVNRETESMFGYRREELIGQKIEILVPDRARTIHRDERERYAMRPRARRMGPGVELQARRRDGSEFPVEIALAPAAGGPGDLTFGFINNVSDRIQMEGQLRQAHKMEAIGQLAGGVAHDFNNLLTVILGNSSLALESPALTEPIRDPLEQITAAADRAAALTRQLLTFAQKHVVQPRRLDFNQQISQTHKILQRLLASSVELEVVLGKDVGEILADPIVIDQVLINLAVNARDAMPDGGHLRIETSVVEIGEEASKFQVGASPGQHIKLTVTDTGTGMTPETIARIFDPFFTTKGPGKGTGLGLASVYGVMKQVGGGIQVSSEPNRGSTFEVFFPRVPAALQSSGKTQDSEQLTRGSETILLVEDEGPLRRLMLNMLGQMGYRTLEARDGEEALRLVEQKGAEIDLILTDVDMPKINGPGLIAGVKRMGAAPRTLFMSGYADDRAVFDEKNDAAFIQKPFGAEQLGQKLREVLNARPLHRTGRTTSAVGGA